MRRKTYLLIFLIIGMIGITHAINISEITATEEEIDLYDDGDGNQGDAGGGPKPRSLPFSPVLATIDGADVKVSFTSNIGDVNVVIKSNSGIEYYSHTTDTSSSNNLVIDISAFPSDEYTITIKAVSGTLSKYGKFIAN